MQTTTEENILNVTLLEPRQKHRVILARFNELTEGERLTIHDDHDLQPLYRQLLAERRNTFTWEYVEQGPDWWKVNIAKRFASEHETTLGEIAANDLRKADVFKKYGFDFCCSGKKTLKEACAEKGLDVIKIELELKQLTEKPAAHKVPYGDWSPGFLADYIVNTHHSYVKKMLPDIREYALKVMIAHGKLHPELMSIMQLVENINAELSAHMIKEERVLFPYIKELEAAAKNRQPLQAALLGTIQDSINLMEMEHEIAGKDLGKIRIHSKNYTLPDDACASYSLLYKMLTEFEEDLHIHIHLENNILFPKALQLEHSYRS